jgi:hypothetical protein
VDAPGAVVLRAVAEKGTWCEPGTGLGLPRGIGKYSGRDSGLVASSSLGRVVAPISAGRCCASRVLEGELPSGLAESHGDGEFQCRPAGSALDNAILVVVGEATTAALMLALLDGRPWSEDKPVGLGRSKGEALCVGGGVHFGSW